MNLILAEVHLHRSHGANPAEIDLKPFAFFAGRRTPNGADVVVHPVFCAVVVARIHDPLPLLFDQRFSIVLLLRSFINRFRRRGRFGVFGKQHPAGVLELAVIPRSVRQGNRIITERGQGVEILILIDSGREQIKTPFKLMAHVNAGAGGVPPVAIFILKKAAVPCRADKAGAFVGHGTTLIIGVRPGRIF